MATKQKEVTTFDVQVAEFIRNHKQKGPCPYVLERNRGRTSLDQ